MSTISRQADARAVAVAEATQMDEMSWAEDLGLTVVALTDPDNPPMEFDETRDVRIARPKRTVELALDIDLLEHLAESPDWGERVNEILRLAARMDVSTSDV